MIKTCCVFASDMDYEPAHFFDHKIRTARKTHKCCECYEEIKPGEKYEFVKSVSEYGWESYKTCLPCKNIRRDLFCGPGIVYGVLQDEFYECYGFSYLKIPEED